MIHLNLVYLKIDGYLRKMLIKRATFKNSDHGWIEGAWRCTPPLSSPEKRRKTKGRKNKERMKEKEGRLYTVIIHDKIDCNYAY